VPVLLTALLAVLTWQVLVDGPLVAIDAFLRHRSQMLRFGADPPAAERIAQALSDLGGLLIAGPVLLMAAGWAALRRRRPGRRLARHIWWPPLLVAAAALLALLASVVPAKALIGRLGPFSLPLQPGQSGFFPSGHAATAAVCFGIALLLVLPAVTARPLRVLLVAGYLLLQGAIGAALVYCDYHWFLDVVGSWCLAGVVLWLLYGAARSAAAPPPDGGSVTGSDSSRST
jgi:undecaprenyl-diphosphatase